MLTPWHYPHSLTTRHAAVCSGVAAVAHAGTDRQTVLAVVAPLRPL